VTDIDRKLLDRTRILESQFYQAIGRLANSSLDLRIFFTMAHGYITGRIGQHIDLFANPNALMRLNDSFTTTYLSALNGMAHSDWQKAFRICKAESEAVRSGPVGLIFVGPAAAESCAACMAKVHIYRDLRDALIKVRDVDPQDYGNVLIFVEEGNLYAECQLRGQVLGSAAVMLSKLIGGVAKLNLDVKQWRNKVFQDCYKKEVPDPSPSFAAAYRKVRSK
jgi:hypothetical protein